MSIAIFTIGTELTRGELIDSNSAWLSERLTAQGLEVTHHESVDDDSERIVDSIRRLSQQHARVFVTGGLGPTSDDLSAACAARAAGVGTSRRADVVAHLERLYASRGRSLTEASLQQADLPVGAEVLGNPVGTAPGFTLTIGPCRFYFMPGVPLEMKAIFESIAHSLPAEGPPRAQIHMRTYGLPESELGERLADIESQFPGVTLGYRASFPEVEVKVLATAADVGAAQDLAAQASEMVSERLGAFVYGGRDDSMASVVGDTLRAGGLTLALAESCTGGAIATMLTEVAGSSSFFLLGAVTYANSAKISVLGVNEVTLKKHGAVSEECAREMARGARTRAGSDIALSVTGIAGPGGGSIDKPVGTVWFGACRGPDEAARRIVFHGDRSRVRCGAAFFALNAIKRIAQGADFANVFGEG